jgi:hypothetical protein
MSGKYHKHCNLMDDNFSDPPITTGMPAVTSLSNCHGINWTWFNFGWSSSYVFYWIAGCTVAMTAGYTEIKDRKYKKVELVPGSFSAAAAACIEDEAELITRIDRAADFMALEELGTCRKSLVNICF